MLLATVVQLTRVPSEGGIRGRGKVRPVDWVQAAGFRRVEEVPEKWLSI